MICPARVCEQASWRSSSVQLNQPKSAQRSEKTLRFVDCSIMKRLFFSPFPLLLFLFASCAPAKETLAVETPPSLTAAPTRTASPTVTPPAAPKIFVPSPTTTPIPCDPHVEAFCIIEGHLILRRPIHPPANDSVEETYRFASTAGGKREPHHGVEFENPSGTPVHAAADGQVVFAGPDAEAVYSPWANFYGNLIVIHHAGGLFTLYAHLSAIGVKEGQRVLAGQKIGEVGLTGTAAGSHLHFEVRHGDAQDYFSALNPELWLRPRAGEGALAISVVDERGAFRPAELTIQSDESVIFLRTYEETFLTMEENAGLTLKAGRYRIALIYGGNVYERWVEVQSGKLTQTIIVVK